MQQHDATLATGVPLVSSQISTEVSQMTPRNPSSMTDAIDHLFQTAVLMLGDEQAAAIVVEQAVAEDSVEDAIDPCVSFDSSTSELMNRVIVASLARMYESGNAPEAPMAASGQASTQGPCIESDDLGASGINSAQLQQLLETPGRTKLRYWLEQLSPSLRAVFVLRAILGYGNDRAATILIQGNAAGWTAEQVSFCYRRALCSLASSLVNSTNPRSAASSRAPQVA